MAVPAERPDWARIGLAVVLAGTIPAVIANVLLLIGIAILGPAFGELRSVYLLIYILLHLLPLLFGMWAGSAWSGQHTKGYGLLGLLAAAIEVIAILLFVSVFRGYIRPEFEDVLAPITTAVLFLAGGLLADMRKRH